LAWFSLLLKFKCHQFITGIVAVNNKGSCEFQTLHAWENYQVNDDDDYDDDDDQWVDQP